jgi:hypothetical protein
MYKKQISFPRRLFNKIRYKLGFGYGGWYHRLTGKYQSSNKPGVVITYEKGGKIKGRF